MSDIIDKWIVLSGGTSLQFRIDELFTKEIVISAHFVHNPLICAARVLRIALQSIDEFKRSLIRG